MTDRLAPVSAIMTPDMVRATVIEALQHAEETAAPPVARAMTPQG